MHIINTLTHTHTLADTHSLTHRTHRWRGWRAGGSDAAYPVPWVGDGLTGSVKPCIAQEHEAPYGEIRQWGLGGGGEERGVKGQVRASAALRGNCGGSSTGVQSGHAMRHVTTSTHGYAHTP